MAQFFTSSRRVARKAEAGGAIGCENHQNPDASNVAADPVYGLSMMGLSMMLRDGDVEVTRLLIQDGTLQRPFRSIALR
jgi:hypothetical protein